MSMYKITVKGAEDINPEYNPDEQLMNGMDADGFMLIAFRNGKPYSVVISHVTTLELAKAFADCEDLDEAASVIQQAIAIAEGITKANEISRKNNRAKRLMDLLKQE